MGCRRGEGIKKKGKEGVKREGILGGD